MTTIRIQVFQIPDGYVCKGEIWSSLDDLTRCNREFWPESTFEIKEADSSVCAFWQAAIKDGTAKIRHAKERT